MLVKNTEYWRQKGPRRNGRAEKSWTPQRGIRPQSPLSAFRLFIDEPMLRSILKFTVNHGKADNPNFSVEIRELEKFIGLQIARGVLVEKKHPNLSVVE